MDYDALPRLAQQRLDDFTVETPSWGYANSGTRFGTFHQPSAARSLAEKLADAGTVHRYTGLTPKVALHIPWDDSDNWDATQALADEHGISIGAINPNVFQDQGYKFGSICHPDVAVRQQAIAMHQRCIEVARATGSKDLSLWFADGTNYPGQDCLRSRRARMLESMQTIYTALDPDMRLLIEYKLFEPAFYHTDLSDWGQAALLCQKLGPQATVLVDTGHHAQGVNIEHIVASLLQENLLGGFHFNARKYADDDLTVGSVNGHEMFLIFQQIVGALHDKQDDVAQRCASQLTYMFDQSHNLKNKIEATIQSAVFVQETYLKALLVDQTALRHAQAAQDIVAAEEVLQDAWRTDVRPALRTWRQDRGLPADPLKAFRDSGYTARVAADRTATHGIPTTAGGYQ
jgi:L-rhamnose isomerase/sugar isomerase